MIYSSFEGRDWLGLGDSFVEKLNFQAVIKSAASAASRNPRGAHAQWLGKLTTGGGWLLARIMQASSWQDDQVNREAALAVA